MSSIWRAVLAVVRSRVLPLLTGQLRTEYQAPRSRWAAAWLLIIVIVAGLLFAWQLPRFNAGVTLFQRWSTSLGWSVPITRVLWLGTLWASIAAVYLAGHAYIIWRLDRSFRQRLRNAGFCDGCGYCLAMLERRGDGRVTCPECGTVACGDIPTTGR